MSQEVARRRMTEGPILPSIIRFAIPILLTNIFQTLYNAFDSIIVGRFAKNGDIALGAVGSMGSVLDLFGGMFLGFATGTTVVASIYFGGKNKEGVERTVHTSMALSLVVGIVVSVLGVVFSPYIISWTDVPKEIAPLANVYARITFIGLLPLTVYNFGAGILRAVGDSKRPLIYLIVSSIFNIVLNCVFVICFDMSADGVAYATVIAEAVSAVLVVVSLMKTNEWHKFNPRLMRFHKSELLQIIKTGIPIALQTVFFSLSNVLVQAEVNIYGTVVVAARSAVTRWENIIWSVVYSFGVASTTFAGQNKGARKYERIKKGMWLTVLASAVTIGILSLFTIIFGDEIIGLFNSKKEVVEVGAKLLTVVFSGYFLCSIMDTISGTIKGSGAPFFPMISTFLGIIGGRLTWIYIMKHIFPMNITVMMLCYPVSWVVIDILLLIFYKTKQNRWLYC